MNARYISLDKLIEIIHSKYNQFKNIIITNMKDNYMYKLDEKTKDIIEKFINKINIDSKYTDYDSKEHDNYKQYKIN